MDINKRIVELFNQENYDFNDLKDIMMILRSEKGCPWDRVQTHKSIRSCMIEEAYEVVEAIDKDDSVLMREELGDVLFEVLFHARIEEEKGNFTVDDSVSDICKKMIARHPHVFRNNPDEPVGELPGWEELKIREKHRNTLSERLRAVPAMLPALMRASKIAGKLEEPTDEEELLSLAETYICNLKDAKKRNSTVLGELLFALAGLSKIWKIDAEEALGQAVETKIHEIEEKEE